MYIYGVHAPYYDGSAEQTELYLKTIDQLQCLVDQTENDIPFVLMGDLNTGLQKVRCCLITGTVRNLLQNGV